MIDRSIIPKLTVTEKVLGLCTFLLLCLVALGGMTRHVSALSASDWSAGQIIDDGIFYNSNDMSVDQVQSFLNAEVPTCDTWGAQQSEYGGGTRAQYGTAHGYAPPYICLKNYYENPTTHASNLANGSIPNGSLSAAQIIVNAAQSYGVSVRVLLATLQKESSGPLITDTWPFPSQYTNAMGYGCPDTAACDPSYAGFYNQVTNAARQFSLYKNNPTNYRYRPQQDNSILYNPSSSCGSSTVFISTFATAGLYNYTPYQPDQAALNNLYGSGDSCSAYGNRNLWRIFNDWFGSTHVPYAFKSADSATVYIYSSGYKYAVPYMGELQDYGISPQAIQTLSQSTIDAIPSGTSANNISTAVSYLIKSPSDSDGDGGSVYFISAGKRYQITSLSQLSDFGFNTNNISYLPLSFVLSIPSGGMLSNFISTPYGSVFQVSGGVKHLILDYASYIQLNPTDKTSYLSYFGADIIPSSTAITSQPVLIKFADSNSVYMLANGSYYPIPTFDTYNCWGFNSSNPVIGSYVIPESAYISPVQPSDSLSCTVRTGGVTYIMSNGVKYSVPASYGIGSALTENSDISQVAALVPTAGSQLNQYVKGSRSAAVWFIDSGSLRVVPTYQDYQWLGLNDKNVTTIHQSALSSLSYKGIKLGDGSLVKTSASSSVYAIGGDTRIAYNTSDAFISHGNNWNNIATYSQSDLDLNYPVNTSPMDIYLYNPAVQAAYLAETNVCYVIPTSLLSSFGLSSSALAANPATSLAASKGFQVSSCVQASAYVKQAGQSLVYKLVNGTRQAVTTYAKLQSDSGQNNPYVITLSDSDLNSFPQGQPL